MDVDETSEFPKSKTSKRFAAKINRDEHTKASDSSLDVEIPLKKLKLTIANSETNEGSSSTQNEYHKRYLKVCVAVNEEEFNDIQARVGVSYPPHCGHTGFCTKNLIDSKNVSKELPTGLQSTFHITYKARNWNDIPTIIKKMVQHNQYPTWEILQLMIKTILNFDAEIDGTSTPMIGCLNIVNALKFIFDTHPPCPKEVIKLYEDFLMKPFHPTLVDGKRQPKSLFFFLLNEINALMNYKSEPSNETGSKNKPEYHSVDELYKAYNSKEPYLSMSDAEKVSRIFLVLDIVIDLLGRDLYIWITKNKIHSCDYMKTADRPLMAIILWNHNYDHTGIVNITTRYIFETFVKMIKNDFHWHYVNIYSQMMNLLSNVYYLCQTLTDDAYPKLTDSFKSFTKEMYKIIEDEPLRLKMKIISKIKSKSIKHLLAVDVLKSIYSFEDENFLVVMVKILTERVWKKFPKQKFNKFESIYKIERDKTDLSKAQYCLLAELDEPYDDEQFLSNIGDDVTDTVFLIVAYYAYVSYRNLYYVNKIGERVKDENKPKINIEPLDDSLGEIAVEYNSSLEVPVTEVMQERVSINKMSLVEYSARLRLLKKVDKAYMKASKDVTFYGVFKRSGIM